MDKTSPTNPIRINAVEELLSSAKHGIQTTFDMKALVEIAEYIEQLRAAAMRPTAPDTSALQSEQDHPGLVWALGMMITQFDAVVQMEEVNWDSYEDLDRHFVSECRKIFAAHVTGKALATPSPAAEGCGDAAEIAKQIMALGSRIERGELRYADALTSQAVSIVATALRAAKLEGAEEALAPLREHIRIEMQHCAHQMQSGRGAGKSTAQGGLYILKAMVAKFRALSAEDVGGQG